jgi:hypothetical protein
MKSNLVFITNPFFQPLNSNFCSSENSMLLPGRAAPRLSKRLTATLEPDWAKVKQIVWVLQLSVDKLKEK